MEIKDTLNHIFFSFYFVLCLLASVNSACGAPGGKAEYGRGLRFKGSETSIDERTSYRVFRSRTPVFRNELSISFDIRTFETVQNGYILRLKDSRNNRTYNISYDGKGGDVSFKLNEEGRATILRTAASKDEFSDHEWNSMEITFLLDKDSVSFTINGSVKASAHLSLSRAWSPEIYFGRSEHLIDVPTFAIKDLCVRDAKKNYCFALDESCGNNVHNPKGKPYGVVSNPVWLINESFSWQLQSSFSSGIVAGCNIDPAAQRLYIFNRDSITSYDIRSGEAISRAVGNRCPIRIRLGTNFIVPGESEMYVYETFDYNTGNPTIAVLDLENGEWTDSYHATLQQPMHHHSGVLLPEEGKYMLFGGFGNSLYNGFLYSLDIPSMRWEVMELGGPDTIHPRYFQSAGYSEEENAIYIFGGMGNESGEQVIGRRYYYDLHRIDLGTHSVTKLWELDWKEENVVPVRGMVLDRGHFYTLCYSEHHTKSNLRLYRFSIPDGQYVIYGDSIPIYSEQIYTNANIYYNPEYSEFCTVVQEFISEDTASRIKMYSLSYPPVSREELNGVASVVWRRKVRNSLLWAIGTAAVLSALYFMGRYRVRKKREGHPLNIEDILTLPAESPNSIYLFGEFTVRDRNNRDISYMFSSKLKQLFLVILSHNKSGISSRKLSELIWPDKQEEKLKNLRGVTVNHLRKILKELDGITLTHEKSVFRLEIGEPLYCDYLSCMALTESESDNPEVLQKELALILARGKFLQYTNSVFFDSFKQSVERNLEPLLQKELTRCVLKRKYRTAVVLAEALFAIDPFDDNAIRSLVTALVSLGMTAEARKRFSAFTADFLNEMGETYPLVFEDLTT